MLPLVTVHIFHIHSFSSVGDLEMLKSNLRKTRRYCPGTVKLYYIRRYQKSTDLLLPNLPFQRWVRKIVQEISDISLGVLFGYRFQTTVLLALQ